jgi:hypothetical protein
MVVKRMHNPAGRDDLRKRPQLAAHFPVRLIGKLAPRWTRGAPRGTAGNRDYVSFRLPKLPVSAREPHRSARRRRNGARASIRPLVHGCTQRLSPRRSHSRPPSMSPEGTHSLSSATSRPSHCSSRCSVPAWESESPTGSGERRCRPHRTSGCRDLRAGSERRGADRLALITTGVLLVELGLQRALAARKRTAA